MWEERSVALGYGDTQDQFLVMIEWEYLMVIENIDEEYICM